MKKSLRKSLSIFVVLAMCATTMSFGIFKETKNFKTQGDIPSGMRHLNQASCVCTVGPIGMGGMQWTCFSLFGLNCIDNLPCEVYCAGQVLPCIMCGSN